MKKLVLSISLMFACVSLSLADQLGFHPTAKNHQVGTRLLAPCSTSGGEITYSGGGFATSSGSSSLFYSSGKDDDECYRELVIKEWAPSGKYVRLCLVSADPKEACGWHRVGEFVAFEELIKK